MIRSLKRFHVKSSELIESKPRGKKFVEQRVTFDVLCAVGVKKLEITEIFKGPFDAGNVGLLCSWRFS